MAGPPDPAFDGDYIGVSSRTRGGERLCGPASVPLAIAVRGGLFHYAVPATTPYALAGTLIPVLVRITADGGVEGATQYEADNPFARAAYYTPTWATVEGHVAGGKVEAQVESYICGQHLVLVRR